ncbi:hypothetical protein [Azospirillum doebereinerae]
MRLENLQAARWSGKARLVSRAFFLVRRIPADPVPSCSGAQSACRL